MRNLQITLSESIYSYSVDIGSSILKQSLANVLKGYQESTVFIVTNQTMSTLFPEIPAKYLNAGLKSETLVLPDGESHKHMGTVVEIIDFLAEKGANRNSILLAFGGGVIGDMAGFAASIFMRGIRFIQIPTTLLSQVDSGIGGKTGVNHTIGKNLIGAFKQPYCTIIDIELLNTLPQQEFIAGYAELVKHGFIRNPELFDFLNELTLAQLREDPTRLENAIFLSCQVKASVVELDEKESGLRAILNFGHTIGHFLETITGYNTMLHGEAVIIGMDFATWWSFRKGVLAESCYLKIHQHLKGLKVFYHIDPVDKASFMDIVGHDKKSVDAGVRFIGLTDIGSAEIFEKVTVESLWLDFQDYLQSDPLIKLKMSSNE